MVLWIELLRLHIFYFSLELRRRFPHLLSNYPLFYIPNDGLIRYNSAALQYTAWSSMPLIATANGYPCSLSHFLLSARLGCELIIKLTRPKEIQWLHWVGYIVVAGLEGSNFMRTNGYVCDYCSAPLSTAMNSGPGSYRRWQYSVCGNLHCAALWTLAEGKGGEWVSESESWGECECASDAEVSGPARTQ